MKRLNSCVRNIVCSLSIIVSSFSYAETTDDTSILATAKDLGSALKKKLIDKEPITAADLGSLLSDITGSTPSNGVNLFKGLTIDVPIVNRGPEKITNTKGETVSTENFYIIGGIEFVDKNGKKEKIEAEILTGIDSKTQKRDWSFTIKLPTNMKLNAVLPDSSLSFPDSFVLPNARFTLTTFEYEDPETNMLLKAGLNVISDVGMSGTMSDVKTFLTKLKSDTYKDQATVGAKGIVFKGLIAKNLKDSQFGFAIPAGIKIDFTKHNKKPVVSEVILGEMDAAIIINPFALAFSASAQLNFSSKKQTPLKLASSFVIDASGFILSAEAIGQLKVTDWLEIDDVGVTIGIGYDSPLLLNALAFRGNFKFGKKGKTELDITGGAALKAEAGTLGDFAFVGSVKQLDFDDIISLLAKIAQKEIKTGTLPVMKLEELDIYIVPVDTTLFGQKYLAGFKVDVKNLNLFGQKGSMSININEATKTVEGKGALDIDIAGVTFDANVDVLVSEQTPEKNKVSFDAAFAIKHWKLYAAINGYWGKVKYNTETKQLEQVTQNITSAMDDGAFFKGEAKLANLFDADLDLQLDFTNYQYSKGSFNMTNSLNDYAVANLKKSLKELKEETEKAAQQIQKKLKKLEAQLGVDQQHFKKLSKKEIEKIKQEIKQTQKEISKDKKKCKNKPWYNKDADVCLKVASEGSKLAGLEAYYNALLKPGTSVVKATLKSIKQLTKEIHDSQVIAKTLTGLESVVDILGKGLAQAMDTIDIQKAAGSFKFDEVTKTPQPSLDDVVVAIKLPGMKKAKQLSFKNLTVDVDNFYTKTFKPFVKQIALSLAKAEQAAPVVS